MEAFSFEAKTNYFNFVKENDNINLRAIIFLKYTESIFVGHFLTAMVVYDI